MGSLDRSDAQLIAEAVTASLKAGGFISNSIANQGGGGTNFAGGGGASFASGVNMLSNGVSTLVNTTGQMVTGTATLSSMIGTLTGVVKIFGPIGQAVGQFGEDVSKYVLQVSAQNQASAEYGANFNQNLGEYSLAIANAGISQEQYNKLLAASGQGVQGLGASAQAGADVYMKISAQMFDSRDVFQARLAGLPLENFQNSLLATSKLMAGQNMNTVEAQKVLQDSAVGAAIEIDNMSRITGRSRQEIQKGIETQLDSTNVAFMKLSMDKEQLAAYEDSLTVVESLGPTITNLFTEMSANRGDVVSKQGGLIKGSLGAIDPRLEGILTQLSTATQKEDRDRLKKDFMEVMGQASMDPTRFAKITALAGDTSETGRTIAQLVKEVSPMLLKSRQLAFEGEKVGKGAGEVYADSIEKAKQEREDALKKAGQPGAGVQQSILFAEDVLKRGNAVLATEIAKGNEKAGRAILNSDKLNEYIKPYTEDMRSQMIPAFMDYFRGKLPGYTGVDTSGERPGQPRPKKMFGTGPEGTSDNVPRVDKWFQNFGTEMGVDLHGVEAVLRKQDVPAFVQDQLKQFPGMLKGMEGGIKEAANAAQANMPTADQFSKIIEQVTSTVKSPATTTTSPSTSFGGSEPKVITDLVTGIDKLNTKMEKLIKTVEESGNKNVRAVKSAGNLAA